MRCSWCVVCVHCERGDHHQRRSFGGDHDELAKLRPPRKGRSENVGHLMIPTWLMHSINSLPPNKLKEVVFAKGQRNGFFGALSSGTTVTADNLRTYE